MLSSSAGSPSTAKGALTIVNGQTAAHQVQRIRAGADIKVAAPLSAAVRALILALAFSSGCSRSPKLDSRDSGAGKDSPPQAQLESDSSTPSEAGAQLDSGTSSSHSHDVLTQHNDLGRTGATLSESVLEPATLSRLYELGRFAIDGEAYAQPLYVEGVPSAGGSKNLLVVATMEDSLFAFDADRPGSAPLWQLASHELGTPAFSARNIGGNNGILATPVIDRARGRLYVLSRDCDAAFPASAPSCAQRLSAIELSTGSVAQQIAIAGGVTSPAGAAVTFDPSLHWGRPALLLTQGTVFVSFGSGPNGNAHEEDFVFHGWLFGYRADDLTQAPSVYCSTPDFGGGAIWQSGAGPAADEDAVYFATGNGIHDPTPSAPDGFPASPAADEDCIVRVPLAAPATSSRYWDDRPYHADGNVFQYMEKNDIDFGTAGPLLIPGSSSLVGGGKAGILYLLDRATLTPLAEPLSAFHSAALASGESLYIYSYDRGPKLHDMAFFRPSVAGSPANVGWLFAWPEQDRLKAFAYDYGARTITELATASAPALPSGGMVSVSAHGTDADSAIVWASTREPDAAGRHLWAFSAATLAPLFDAHLDAWAKFAVPTIAAGKVFLASTSNAPGNAQAIVVFGL